MAAPLRLPEFKPWRFSVIAGKDFRTLQRTLQNVQNWSIMADFRKSKCCIVAEILEDRSKFSKTLVTRYSLPNYKKISGELESCDRFWRYPPLWTSLLVAMHDDIENTSVGEPSWLYDLRTSGHSSGEWTCIKPFLYVPWKAYSAERVLKYLVLKISITIKPCEDEPKKLRIDRLFFKTFSP